MTFTSRPVPVHSYAVKKPHLIASLEGERGMPRLKPPFPAAKGFWQKPTDINNVETLANVPWIIFNGGAAFGTMGTERVQGHQGIRTGRQDQEGRSGRSSDGPDAQETSCSVSAAASRTTDNSRLFRWADHPAAVFRQSLIDTPVTYEDINKTGAIVGSGGMIVMDEDTCMVDMARYFLNFTRDESCGKCNYCRIGTKRMLEILERITRRRRQRRRYRTSGRTGRQDQGRLACAVSDRQLQTLFLRR